VPISTYTPAFDTSMLSDMNGVTRDVTEALYQPQIPSEGQLWPRGNVFITFTS
jgi:hypothetical protein